MRWKDKIYPSISTRCIWLGNTIHNWNHVCFESTADDKYRFVDFPNDPPLCNDFSMVWVPRSNFGLDDFAGAMIPCLTDLLKLTLVHKCLAMFWRSNTNFKLRSINHSLLPPSPLPHSWMSIVNSMSRWKSEQLLLKWRSVVKLPMCFRPLLPLTAGSQRVFMVCDMRD